MGISPSELRAAGFGDPGAQPVATSPVTRSLQSTVQAEVTSTIAQPFPGTQVREGERVCVRVCVCMCVCVFVCVPSQMFHGVHCLHEGVAFCGGSSTTVYRPIVHANKDTNTPTHARLHKNISQVQIL